MVASIFKKRWPPVRLAVPNACRLPQGLQLCVPSDDRLNFFRCEGWEDEVGIHCLPRQSLGFIERQPQQAFMRFERFGRLVKNHFFDPGDPRQNLSARWPAVVLQCRSAFRVSSVLIRIVLFHTS